MADTGMTDRERKRALVRQVIAKSGLESIAWSPDHWTVAVPAPSAGRPIDVDLWLGDYTLSISAFLMRQPLENREAVYYWLLRRQAVRSPIRFWIDDDGDLALRADLLVSGIDLKAIDVTLAAIALEHERAFGHLLEIGWASLARARSAAGGSS